MVLLTASVVLGIVTSVRWSSPRSASLRHRVPSSQCRVARSGVSMYPRRATVVVDGFAPIGWKDAVVPFVSAYRPLWLGLGAIVLSTWLWPSSSRACCAIGSGNARGVCSTGSCTCAGPSPCSTGWAPAPTRSSALCWARTWSVSSRFLRRSGGGSPSAGRNVPAPASLLSGSASWHRSSWPYGWSRARLLPGGHARRVRRDSC